ncbi:RHS domain-containing protein [Pseudomonas syringae pv. syringae]|nr:RHS repeat-associated core domain-containing protein [Pseudomonas syringae]MCH5556181.1 RHS domain-containing protein [Pseudomonas syringae pv. syringae]MCH5576538.1 RHS domain-containing protein [Pseudomonas syringae pv. syringae]MCH5668799.1 RHS domain-containing protein [Pseudomonas syringae pv. syringae]
MADTQVESTSSYQHDSLGKRVFKQSEIKGQTDHKRFLWQGLRMLREESPGQSSLYLYEPGSYAPLARVDEKEGEVENKVYYFHTDQIGTPLEMTDAEGQIVWQAKYRAWGAVEKLVVNEVEQNLRFQGQYFDVETGLHYNTFRYYDPEIGRFTTQDPIGLLGGFNLYRYTPNPVRWTDALGLVHELTPGYNVYGLFQEGAEKPYYVGVTDDLARRRNEHVGTNRLGPGTEMVPLDKNVNYGQARGYEQAYIEHYETKTGVIGKGISPASRGNKINSFDHESTLRAPSRQAAKPPSKF